MITYRARQDARGAWHTVYTMPGCGVDSSVMEATSRSAAQAEATRLNQAQAREAEADRVLAAAPIDRPIARGFYSDEDAR